MGEGGRGGGRGGKGREGEGREGEGRRGEGKGGEGRGGERKRISCAVGDLHNTFLQGGLLHCLCLVL